MRALLWLLGILLLVGALVVIADQVFVRQVEERLAEEVSATLDAPTEVDLISLPIPVSIQLFLGTVRRGELTATDVPVEGGTIDRLDVTLEDVEVSWADVQEQDVEQLPPARAGRFAATLSEASVQELVGIPDGVAAVRLDEGVLVLEAVGLAIEADVEAQDGVIVVSPREQIAELLGAGSFTVDLSGQPGSPQAEEVEIDGGELIVRGTLAEVERSGG